MTTLEQSDPAIARIIQQEQERQKNSINLIASENYTSPAVLAAMGSVLTDKYAEGYPGKRYYAGCQYVDQVELLAIERLKQLFGAEHANVQPHAGSQANMAAYYAMLEPGDTIMGMRLSEGGHLTHGHPMSFSGRLYSIVSYTVNPETELLDFNQIRRLAHEHKPKLIVCGASAYPRTIDFAQFAQIAQEVGAYLMADIAHIAGPIAANLHPTPIGHADVVTSTTHKTLRGPRGGIIMAKQEHAERIDKAVMPGIQGGPFMNQIAAKAVAFHLASEPTFVTYQQQVLANARAMAQEFVTLGYRVVTGGTDNHLFLVDLRSKGITGRQAEQALEAIGIYVNRNTIPFDTEKPWITSGIRIGTPAMTTRGMDERLATEIVHMIHDVLSNSDNTLLLGRMRDGVAHINRMLG